MKAGLKIAGRLALFGVAVLLVVGVVAPYLHADQFGNRIRTSLEQALGRRVEIGRVRFSLFTGPGFSIEKVVIHEDPSLGIEPAAYVETLTVVPRFWALIGGRLEISSIRLTDCDINLVKTGASSEPGRWNFQPLVRRSVSFGLPGLHVRRGRVNFKFGDVKSVFYLLDTDVDILPPGRGGAWRFRFAAAPARTDRPAQGLGSFEGEGRWTPATGKTPDHIDMDLVLERTGVGELLALLHGQRGGIHGMVTSRMHLAGPLTDIGISGQLRIEDIHRWDMLPPKDGGWPLYVRGKLDLATQRLEMESSSTEKAPLPLAVRFRITDYLAQPHWDVALNWNRFQLQPLLDLARHMGIALPAKLQIAGAMDGAVSLSDRAGLQGEIAVRDTVVTIPDSPPVRFEQARVLFGQGRAHLEPAVVRSAEDEARIEADYAWATDTFALTIAAETMKVSSLREQVSLAAVPWLEQLRSGAWRGELRYRRAPDERPAWSGELQVNGGSIVVPGLAHPVQLETARARILGARVVIDRIRASAGAISFTGDYRYEPQVVRPHRVRLLFDELNAAELERELAPTLRRGGSFIARAFGRAPLPDWLRQRSLEGTVHANTLLLGGARIESLRGHLIWEAARAELDGLRATLEGGRVTGKLALNLRGPRPSYRLTAAMKGMHWQSGHVDADGTVESGGTGFQLLTNLNAEGTFSGHALDLGFQSPCKSISGTYKVTWSGTSPRLRFNDLQLALGDETFTGRGGTADDGRLAVVFSNPTREMRVSGTLAKLKIDEAARP